MKLILATVASLVRCATTNTTCPALTLATQGTTDVVDSQRVNSANPVTGTVALRRGWHPIRLRFLEYGYNDGLTLTWSGPGMKRKEIAADQLGHLVQE